MKHKIFSGEVLLTVFNDDGGIIASAPVNWWMAECGNCNMSFDDQLWINTLSQLSTHINKECI